MSATRCSCPSCQTSLRLPASLPANTRVRCPKCGECFQIPSPTEESQPVIPAAEVTTAPRAPQLLDSPATAPKQDREAMRNIRRAAPRSRKVLWIVLGALAAGFFLLLVGVGIGAAVWLRRLTVSSVAPPQARFVPHPQAPPSAPANQPASADEWFTKGNHCMQRGDLDGAINAFTRAIELKPRFAAAYCNRGLARSNKGDLDGGIADSSKSIELNPSDPFPFINRANARIRKGIDPDASIADASHALELRPGIPAALLNLGMARDLKRDYAGAIAAFDQALARLPTFDMAYYQRGQTWMKQKKWDKAEADFTHALENNFTHPMVYQHRGVCRSRQGNRQDALEDFTTVAQLNPGSETALLSRAGIYAWLGEKDKALADYAAALKIAPQPVAVYLLRGWFYLSLGQAKEASADADAGLKLAGRQHPHAPYLAILAHCARRQQHPEEARRIAAEAMSKQDKKAWPEPVFRYLHDDISAEKLLQLADSNDQQTEARAYIGAVLWLSGAAAKAREHWEWVRDHGNPEFMEYDLSLMLLHRLEK